MKTACFSALAAFALLAASNPALGIQTESSATMPSAKAVAQATPEKSQKGDQKIRFTFQEQDWKDVIPWFADQTNYSLQPISDYPAGSFTLKDDSEYTVMEAMDQLNHALRVLEEPYTIIRRRNMLFMTKLDDGGFPNELIETVAPEDLDNRGLYEIMTCIFDAGTLNAGEIGEELDPYVTDMHADYFAIFPTANQIRVRGAGNDLRKIRDTIKKAQEKNGVKKMIVYKLKQQDAETFLVIARPHLNIPDGQNARDDGSLSISVEPFGERLFVGGNSKSLAEFEAVAAQVDTAADEDTSDVALDKPTIELYPVMVDPKLAFDVLSTILEGRDDVRMQQDENTGSITIRGRAEDHELVVDTLAAISGDANAGFAIIPLINADPADIMSALLTLFDKLDEDSDGPVLLANSVLNHIIVRGTPQEVVATKQMVAQLDASAVVDTSNMIRTRRRVLEMGEREYEDLAPIIGDLLQQSGRVNPLNMIKPEDRSDIKKSIQRQQGGQKTQEQMIDDFMNSFPAPNKSGQQSAPKMQGKSGSMKTGQLRSSAYQSLFVLSQLTSINPFLVNGLVAIQESEAGQTSEEAARQAAGDYRPAPQLKSVPGAPIEVKYVNGNLILDSEDLDALDDLVWEIQNRVDLSDGTEQAPTFFFLKYRKADQMQASLENFFGFESAAGGGGGGGGGVGGLLGGVMGNALGTGGDLFDGLLSGGTGGGGDAGTLEGPDVRFGIDLPFNAVYVVGATDGDIDKINDIIDMLDQPNGPTQPEFDQFRTIEVIHRDPTAVKEIIERQLSGLLDTGQTSGGQGGGQQAQQTQQMLAALSQLSGGKQRKGNTANPEEEKPKAKLGVDPDTKKLLVHGPEFIYQEVLKMVIELDQPFLTEPPAIEIMPNVKNPRAMAVSLKQMFGDQIEIVGPDGTPMGGGTTAQPGQPQGGATAAKANAASTAANNQARSAIFSALQQQARGGGGGQRGAGGGQTRGGGGGGRGGGGRGGR